MVAVGTLVLVGCGGGAPSQAITLTPTVATKSVMECLSQEAQKLEYKVILLDREEGNMVAERRDSKPAIDSPREYAGGDMLKVTHMKKQGDVVPLSITPSSFIMEWLANGANRQAVATTERARKDAQALSENCKL
jgi:hypothetical protein